MSGESSTYFSAESALSNLLMSVVMMPTLFLMCLIRLRPDVARSLSRPQAAKVLPSCLSRSLRSVTRIMRGLVSSGSRDRARASMTMVMDFPEPCVCQTIPPMRRPSLSFCLMRFMAARTKKNCW